MSLACAKRGAVTPDSVTNSIVIIDVPAALDELEGYARSLDLRPAQVTLRAKIILVDRTRLEGMGLRYDLGSRAQFFNDIVPRLDSVGVARTDPGQIALGGNLLSAIANATQRVPSAAVQLVYSTAIGGFDFTSFLEALQQTSILDVQGEPSLTVLNNQTAKLVAGTEVPLRTIDAGSAAPNAQQAVRATVTTKQTGIILQVTPQVTNNREVMMRIHIENSDVTFVGVDAQQFPVQQADNQVIVADGETAVLAALAQTVVRYTRTGIPFLVDLPVIGRLFGVTQREETKRDLLLLITPHSLDPGQEGIRPPGEQPRN
jgi:type IV pilus assembly protein PilQ